MVLNTLEPTPVDASMERSCHPPAMSASPPDRTPRVPGWSVGSDRHRWNLTASSGGAMAHGEALQHVGQTRNLVPGLFEALIVGSLAVWGAGPLPGRPRQCCE